MQVCHQTFCETRVDIRHFVKHFRNFFLKAAWRVLANPKMKEVGEVGLSHVASSPLSKVVPIQADPK